MDDTESEIFVRAKKFSNRLHGRFALPVDMMDERLSSFAAKEALNERDDLPKDISIDSISACPNTRNLVQSKCITITLVNTLSTLKGHQGKINSKYSCITHTLRFLIYFFLVFTALITLYIIFSYNMLAKEKIKHNIINVKRTFRYCKQAQSHTISCQ